MIKSERGFPYPVFARILLDPTGEGGGGTGGGGEESFTKQQVEQMIQGRVAKLKLENDQLKQQLEDSKASQQNLQTRIQELEDKIAKGNTSGGSNADAEELRGQLVVLKREHQQQIESLTNRFNMAEKKATDADAKRRNVERDTEISEGLIAAGCRKDALETGKRNFLPQVIRDEETDSWKFKLADGSGLVSIASGIQVELPDYMRDPSVVARGSGSKGGKPVLPEGKLKTERDKLVTLKATADRTNKSSDIEAYQKQKRLVTQLEKQDKR